MKCALIVWFSTISTLYLQCRKRYRTWPRSSPRPSTSPAASMSQAAPSSPPLALGTGRPPPAPLHDTTWFLMSGCRQTVRQVEKIHVCLTRWINVRSKDGVLWIDSAEFFVVRTEFHLKCLYASAKTKNSWSVSSDLTDPAEIYCTLSPLLY